jgi:hypothetical protein
MSKYGNAEISIKSYYLWSKSDFFSHSDVEEDNMYSTSI